MTHRASRKFWMHYRYLLPEIQRLADKNFEIMKSDPRHPSLQFKKVGRTWSARVGARYRALAVEEAADLVWFWIGTHSEYNQIVKH